MGSGKLSKALAFECGGRRPAKAGCSIEVITSKEHYILITMALSGGDWLRGGWHNEGVISSKKNSNSVHYNMQWGLKQICI